jgi:dihydrofolate reductase
MRISLIAAQDIVGVIGSQGALPWHLPADMARFKALTTGHIVIMGRLTYESIGRPLPNRLNIVITRGRKLTGDILIANSLEEAFRQARHQLVHVESDEVFVIGGGEIYRQALPVADKVYLTVVESQFPGDTYFPTMEETWRLITSESFEPDEKNAYPYRFDTYERRRP